MASKSKGFTLIEMMVSLVLFGLLIMLTLQFLMWQGKGATDSRSQKNINEMISNACNLIMNDVLHAGAGLVCRGPTLSRPRLGLWVDDTKMHPLSYNQNDILVINWPRFLDYDAQPTATNIKNQSQAILKNIFQDIDLGSLAWFPSSNPTMTLVPTSVKINNVSKSTPEIGGLLSQSGSTRVAYFADITSSNSTNPNALGTQNLTFAAKTFQPVPSTTTPSGDLAPAIIYRFQPYNSGDLNLGGQLLRNEIPILGNEVLSGYTKVGNEFAVTSFTVECKFYDPVANLEYWSPQNGTFSNMNMNEIKLLRIHINYMWRQSIQSRIVSDSDSGRIRSKVIVVSPRTLVSAGVACPE